MGKDTWNKCFSLFFLFALSAGVAWRGVFLAVKLHQPVELFKLSCFPSFDEGLGILCWPR